MIEVIEVSNLIEYIEFVEKISPDYSVIMTGPAETIYEGETEL